MFTDHANASKLSRVFTPNTGVSGCLHHPTLVDMAVRLSYYKRSGGSMTKNIDGTATLEGS